MANIRVSEVEAVNALERAGYAATERNIRKVMQSTPKTTAKLLDVIVASVDMPCAAKTGALF